MEKKQKFELALIIIAAVLLAAFNWESIVYFNNPAKRISAQHDDKVVLYATDWCQYCARVRKIFNSHALEFVEYDIEKSTRAMKQYQEIGGQGVPVILYEGEVIVGFNPQKTLAIAKSHSS